MASLDRRKRRILLGVKGDLRQSRNTQAGCDISLDNIGIGCCQDNVRRNTLGLEGTHHRDAAGKRRVQIDHRIRRHVRERYAPSIQERMAFWN